MSRNWFCHVDIPQAYPRLFTSATAMMAQIFGLAESERIPSPIRETHESQSPIIPIVFIPIFLPIFPAYSCNSIPGTPIMARRI